MNTSKGYQSKWSVFSMSVPIFIETALQMMVPNIDQFMLSRYSQNSVAAVGNDNVIFKWLRLWQNEGRVSRRLPVTTSSDTGVELLPVEITPDEQKEPVAAIAPSLSTSTQTRVSASSCKVEFRHGNMTLENPSPELLTVLIRELTGRGR